MIRTETLWQGQRRAARLEWWDTLLQPSADSPWGETWDEMVRLRFQLAEEAPALSAAGRRPASSL